MKLSLMQSTSQQLTLSTQLMSSIHLLQLSSVELGQEIQDFLEKNPLLESPENEDENYFAEAEGNKDKKETDYSESPFDISGAVTATSLSDIAEFDVIPNDLPVDTVWNDIYDEMGSGKTSYAGADDGELDWYPDKTQSLSQYLQWQVYLSKLNKKEVDIANAIIDSISDDGYLTASLEDIQSGLDFEVGIDEITALLRFVQNLDPVGVGARDIAECMLLQLNQMASDTPFLEEAKLAVTYHMDCLAKHDHRTLKRKLHVDDTSLQQIIKLIQTLNPRPGSKIITATVKYVVPDVIVKKEKSSWRLELNDSTIPRLQVNKQYASLIHTTHNSSDSTYIRNQLNEAKWFLKSIRHRNQTLLKVSSYVIEHQRDFLEYGLIAMKPLLLREVADALGMHESTISRITTQKYIHTPRGIFELKYFFSNSLTTHDGNQCSATAIRAFIKESISHEDTKNPLRDKTLVDLLSEKGVQVSRRTVAKYRESMTIPP